eukprot:7892981-Alexandrium_andersonii.AAC.1
MAVAIEDGPHARGAWERQERARTAARKGGPRTVATSPMAKSSQRGSKRAGHDVHRERESAPSGARELAGAATTANPTAEGSWSQGKTHVRRARRVLTSTPVWAARQRKPQQ